MSATLSAILGLISFAIFAIIRVLKDDRVPLRLPPRWRPILAVSLGLVAGGIAGAIAGAPPVEAIGGGVASGLGAILWHVFVVDVSRDGAEVGGPATSFGQLWTRLSSGKIGPDEAEAKLKELAAKGATDTTRTPTGVVIEEALGAPRIEIVAPGDVADRAKMNGGGS